MDWASCVIEGSVPTLNCIPHLFQLLVNTLLAFAGTIAAIFIIISGFRFIVARGDAKELETARKTFFYALLGLLIVLVSFLIINLIGFFTGVTCINNFGFSNCTK